MKEKSPLSARRNDKFLIQSSFIRSEDTNDPQSIVRTVSLITQTHLKSLQWNVRDAASDDRIIYSQKYELKRERALVPVYVSASLAFLCH